VSPPAAREWALELSEDPVEEVGEDVWCSGARAWRTDSLRSLPPVAGTGALGDVSLFLCGSLIAEGVDVLQRLRSFGLRHRLAN